MAISLKFNWAWLIATPIKKGNQMRDWIENIFCTVLFFAVAALWIYIFFGLGFFEAL
tara:strand:+ start:345 stop:515 length:171 start_codon:yes stop_codon:yes gene_type:complete